MLRRAAAIFRQHKQRLDINGATQQVCAWTTHSRLFHNLQYTTYDHLLSARLPLAMPIWQPYFTTFDVGKTSDKPAPCPSSSLYCYLFGAGTHADLCAQSWGRKGSDCHTYTGGWHWARDQ